MSTRDLGLLDRLREAVGASRVLTEPERLSPYLKEERRIYQGVASAVVQPATTQEVAEVVRLCASAGAPIVPQGGNTGACGGGVPQHPDAIVVSTERLNRIRHLDADNLTLTAEAGCILADLQQAAQEAGCFFPLSLGGEGSCRIGGNLSTNAGGINVLRFGNARELMLGLEVVLPDGRVWDGLRALRKDNTGYALRHLFVGAEGTLGIITACVLRLFPYPHHRETALLAVPSPQAALRVLQRAQRSTANLLNAFELMPREGLDIGMKNMPGGREPFNERHPWYVLAEVSASADIGLKAALERALAESLEAGDALDAVVAQSQEQRRALWRLREINAGGHQWQEGGIVKHDIAVPVSQVPALIERATLAAQQACAGIRVIAFGHMGDGNVHFNLVQPPGMPAEAFMARRAELNRLVHDIVDELGGSISAEHGIGLLRVDEMARYKDPLELELMHQLKTTLDPLGLMNPGKVLPPAASTQQRPLRIR
jgi:FAD/FMN-containing dehydrogenase